MALETLKGVTEIDGFKVFRNLTKGDAKDGARVLTEEGERVIPWKDFGDKFREEHPIGIHDGSNLISFKIQNGPIKEAGVNGCQVDTLAATIILMIQELDKKFPDECNKHALSNFSSGLGWLKQRKRNREARGVEGLNKA